MHWAVAKGVQGPLGYVRVYVHGMLHTWGLVSVVGIGSMCRGDTVHEPDLRLVLWFSQVAVAACIDGKGGSSEWQLDVCT